jgi:hypothetical protein
MSGNTDRVHRGPRADAGQGLLLLVFAAVLLGVVGIVVLTG